MVPNALKVMVEASLEKYGKDYLPPLQIIRIKCLECCGDSRLEVKLCAVTRCPLYHYRLGSIPENKGQEYTTIGTQGEDIIKVVPPTAYRAILEKCKDCSGSDFDPNDCKIEEYSSCPLLHYRQQRESRKQARRDQMTPEERKAISARLRNRK